MFDRFGPCQKCGKENKEHVVKYRDSRTVCQDCGYEAKTYMHMHWPPGPYTKHMRVTPSTHWSEVPPVYAPCECGSTDESLSRPDKSKYCPDCTGER